MLYFNVIIFHFHCLLDQRARTVCLSRCCIEFTETSATGIRGNFVMMGQCDVTIQNFNKEGTYNFVVNWEDFSQRPWKYSGKVWPI